MPTITTLLGLVMVMGIFLFAVFRYVRALSRMAARDRQTVKVDLDAWRFRLHVSIEPARSRESDRLTAPGEDAIPAQD